MFNAIPVASLTLLLSTTRSEAALRRASWYFQASGFGNNKRSSVTRKRPYSGLKAVSANLSSLIIMENVLHSCSKKSVKTMLCMHNTPWPCMICDGDTINVLDSCLHPHAKSMSNNIWKNIQYIVNTKILDVCMWDIVQPFLLHTIILHLHSVLLVNVTYSTPRKAVHLYIEASETAEQFSVAQWNDNRQKCQVS